MIINTVLLFLILAIIIIFFKNIKYVIAIREILPKTKYSKKKVVNYLEQLKINEGKANYNIEVIKIILDDITTPILLMEENLEFTWSNKYADLTFGKYLPHLKAAIADGNNEIVVAGILYILSTKKLPDGKKVIFCSTIGTIETEISKFNEYVIAHVHELKTPLTAIKGYTQLIDIDGYSEEYQEEIKKAISQLETTINDLIVLGDSPKLETVIHPDEINSVIKSIISQYATGTIQFTNDSNKLPFNMNDFNLILSNLVSNSAKYGKGEIYIHVTNYDIKVSDYGEELSKHIRDNLGTKYYSNHGSSGVGLYFVSEIAKHQNWALKYNREKNMNQFMIVREDKYEL